MSGVIGKDGQQWEHCNHCGVFIEIEKLTTGYSPKWPKHEFVDLCPTCKRRIRKKYVHLFTVFNNWRTLLWLDAMKDDYSLKQYSRLLTRFLNASRGMR